VNVPTGEIVSIPFICIAAFLLLGPLTFLLGGMFVVVCSIGGASKNTEKSADIVSRVYLWESIGAAVGGIIFSFILVELLSSLFIVFALSMLNIGVMVFLSDQSSMNRKIGIASIVLLIAVFISGLLGRVDSFSRKMQWKGLDVVSVTDSKYGNIALTKLGSEYSLFESGLLSYSTRDDVAAEEIIHFSLLEHQKPERVLLIGNGFSGQIRELLRYKKVVVDYVEIDPKVIKVSQTYLPEDLIEPLSDERVKVILSDARMLVKRSAEKYDVIIVSLADPYTALINRYYTLEFYKEAVQILNPDGILSLSVSSSENYLNEENKEFLRSINSTLKEIFPDVKSIPGDTNIFIACKSPGILTLDHKVLSRRLEKRGVETKYVSKHYLPYRLSKDRLEYIEHVLSKKGTLNLDMRPIAYLYDIVLWSTHFNTSFKTFIERIKDVSWKFFFGLPLFILIAGWFWKRSSPTFPITLSIATTGFSEIVFQIIIILAFQTLYGYAYNRIGLIVASFMIGLVLGSLVARKFLKLPVKKIKKIYKIAQLIICFYPLLLPVVFIVFRDAQVAVKFSGLFATIFAILPVVAGFIGGMQYPLAVRILGDMKSKGRQKVFSAGFLYGMDVIGAAVGALLAGMILVPIFGITTIAFLCAAVNAAVFILLLSL